MLSLKYLKDDSIAFSRFGSVGFTLSGAIIGRYWLNRQLKVLATL